MKAMSHLIFAFAMLAVMASYGTAGATPLWSSPAVGCVGDSPSIHGGTYANNGIDGLVAQVTGSTVTVSMYCQVSVTTGPTSITLTYQDYSSTAGNQVVATYYKMDRTTGTLTALAAANSDNGTVGGGLHDVSATISDTIDNSTYYYFIAVYIARTGTGVTEDFYGVRLN